MISAAQIRAARHLAGLTQLQLAKRAGISEASVKNLERGTNDPRYKTLEALEKAFLEEGIIFLGDGDIKAGGSGLRFKNGK